MLANARYDGTTYDTEFNEQYNDNAYVGFMYGAVGASTYAATHANINKSTILQNLEKWYKNNLTSYEDKLADTIWCNDKSTVNDIDYGFDGKENGTNFGIGTNGNYYSGTERLQYKKNALFIGLGTGPTFICPNDNDGGKLSKFTVSDTINGNGALDYKIGLLTADEISYAGASYDENTSYYLYENTGNTKWWTLTPMGFRDIDGGSTFITIYGARAFGGLYRNFGLRPAISLKSTVLFTQGTGTSSDPFVVS